MKATVKNAASAVSFPTLFQGHAGSLWLIMSQEKEYFTGICVHRGRSKNDHIGKYSQKIRVTAGKTNNRARPNAVRLVMPAVTVLSHVPADQPAPNSAGVARFLRAAIGCFILRDPSTPAEDRAGVPLVVANPRCKYRDGGIVCSAKSCPHMRTAEPQAAIVELEQE